MPKNSNTENLWALHIIGPDDVIAAPSFDAASQAADRFNALFGERAKSSGVVCEAKEIPWPHGDESHAHSLAKDWPQYADLAAGAGDGR